MAQAYVNRSVARANVGRFHDAVDDATKAIELEPSASDLANAYFVRAIAGAELGREEEAEADFATSCELGQIAACDTSSGR